MRTEVYHSSQWEFGSNGIRTKSLFSYLSAQQLDDRLKEDLISSLQANLLSNIQDVVGFRQELDSIHGRWKRDSVCTWHIAVAGNERLRPPRTVVPGNAHFAGQHIDLMPLV